MWKKVIKKHQSTTGWASAKGRENKIVVIQNVSTGWASASAKK